MVKGAIHQGEIVKIIVYTPNTRASNYMKQLLMSLLGDMDANIIIVGDNNTPLTQLTDQQDRNNRTYTDDRTNGLTRYIQILTSHEHKIYIFFNHTCYLLQD